MKKITLSFICLLSVILLFAQAPEKFNYQAVVRDASGNIRADASVAIQLSLLKGSTSGTVVYIENHSTTTNSFGLINLELGGGSIDVGSIGAIDWTAGPYFLRVRVDGVEYGTTQILSVPYALYAEKAGNAFSGAWEDLTGKPGFSAVATSGSYDDLLNRPTTLAGYGITDADNSTTNEIQVLGLSGSDLSLSNGGGTVKLPSYEGDNWGKQSVVTDVTLSGNGISASPLGVADGSITSAKISNSSITALDLANNSVVTDKIADASVTTSKIADGNIFTQDLANSSVTTEKIADGTITSNDLGTNSVISIKIVDGTVSTDDLANSSVSSVKILDGSIVTADLAEGIISSSKIADGSVNTADLANNSVTSIKIADESISAADIANSAVTTQKISSTGASANDVLVYNGSQVTWDYAPGSVINYSFLNVPYGSTGSFGSTFIKITNIGTITKLDPNSKLEVTFYGRIYVSSFTSGTGGYFELRIDDNATTNGRANANLRLSEAGGSNGLNVCISGVFTGFGSGIHTISMWARAMSTGSGSGATINPGNWAGDYVIVKEIK